MQVEEVWISILILILLLVLMCVLMMVIVPVLILIHVLLRVYVLWHISHKCLEIWIIWIWNAIHIHKLLLELLLIEICLILMIVAPACSLSCPCSVLLSLLVRILTLLMLHILKVHSLLLVWQMIVWLTLRILIWLLLSVNDILVLRVHVILRLIIIIIQFFLLRVIVVIICLHMILLFRDILNEWLIIFLLLIVIIIFPSFCQILLTLSTVFILRLFFLREKVILFLWLKIVRIIVLIVVFIIILGNINLMVNSRHILLIAPLLHKSMLLLMLLLVAHLELVAYALIIHLREENLLKPIVVSAYLELVCNHVFNSIVVAHNFNYTDHALLLSVWFRKHFVVVPSDQKVRNCVTCAYFYLAVVPSEYKTISGFHYSHWNRVIWNIDWVIRLLLVWLRMRPSTAMMTLSLRHLVRRLTELRHMSLWHLTKCLSNTLLKVYKNKIKCELFWVMKSKWSSADTR